MKILSRIVLWLLGWEYSFPLDRPRKCVIISAPHTSNWDFLIGRCYSYIGGVKAKYLMKSSLFFPVLGTILKWNGAIPVDRSYKKNVVDQIVEKFNNSDDFILGIAPEGTRSRVDKWKTGFYYIAYEAKVPIFLLGMDFKNKRIDIIDSIFPTGDIDKDMLFIQDKFKNIQGKIPENYNPIIR